MGVPKLSRQGARRRPGETPTSIGALLEAVAQARSDLEAADEDRVSDSVTTVEVVLPILLRLDVLSREADAASSQARKASAAARNLLHRLLVDICMAESVDQARRQFRGNRLYEVCQNLTWTPGEPSRSEHAASSTVRRAQE